MSDPAQLNRPAQTWKLILAYDGTDFQGWQIQPGLVTIQGELQTALGRITGGESPLPQGSGRTDAGVHALAQVASFSLQAPIPAENLLHALNRTLPPSIRISEARTVRSSFHARHSAIAKTYEYRIYTGPLCPPFLARYVYSFPGNLNLGALQDAANVFLGEHDFTSFAASDPDRSRRVADCEVRSDQDDKFCNERLKGSVKAIYSSSWESRQVDGLELLVYRVRGSGFLHHMVRNLVGTMLEAGRSRLPLNEIPRILAARNRSAAGPTAPARGLYLHSVEYPLEQTAAGET